MRQGDGGRRRIREGNRLRVGGRNRLGLGEGRRSRKGEGEGVTGGEWKEAEARHEALRRGEQEAGPKARGGAQRGPWEVKSVDSGVGVWAEA